MGLQPAFAEWGVPGEPAEPPLSVRQMMEEVLHMLSLPESPACRCAAWGSQPTSAGRSASLAWGKNKGPTNSSSLRQNINPRQGAGVRKGRKQPLRWVAEVLLCATIREKEMSRSKAKGVSALGLWQPGRNCCQGGGGGSHSVCAGGQGKTLQARDAMRETQVRDMGKTDVGQGGARDVPRTGGLQQGLGGQEGPLPTSLPSWRDRALPRSAPRPHGWVCPVPPAGGCGVGGRSGSRTPPAGSPALPSPGGKSRGNGSSDPSRLNAHLESYSCESLQEKVALPRSPSSR